MHCSIFKMPVAYSLRDSLNIISRLLTFVNPFFQISLKKFFVILFSLALFETAYQLYHNFWVLSTPFFNFLEKTFFVISLPLRDDMIYYIPFFDICQVKCERFFLTFLSILPLNIIKRQKYALPPLY